MLFLPFYWPAIIVGAFVATLVGRHIRYLQGMYLAAMQVSYSVRGFNRALKIEEKREELAILAINRWQKRIENALHYIAFESKTAGVKVDIAFFDECENVLNRFFFARYMDDRMRSRLAMREVRKLRSLAMQVRQDYRLPEKVGPHIEKWCAEVVLWCETLPRLVKYLQKQGS